MFKNVDEFLLCGPYVGIWSLVVGRVIQSNVNIKLKRLHCPMILWGPKSEIKYSILMRDKRVSEYFMIWNICGAQILHYNDCWFGG